MAPICDENEQPLARDRGRAACAGKMDESPTCSTFWIVKAIGLGLLLTLTVTGCRSLQVGAATVFPVVFRVPVTMPPAQDDALEEGSEPGQLRPYRSDASAFVERALQRRGLRFGTDGTVESIHAYMKFEHRLVPARRARPGDVVFFALGDPETCGDHAGVVEGVDRSGRIVFGESRFGQQRRSYVHPARPAERRDAQGRILNTFLRARRPDDPPAARYFAGEMLCAVGRPR